MTEKDKKSEERKFPTRYQDIDTLAVTNRKPGFVYRWVIEDFTRVGKPAPEYRGWIPVNHNLGDQECLLGTKPSSDGLVRMKTLLLCKSTLEWKADRDATHENRNASRETSIKQKAIQELERLRFKAIDGIDTKKTKMVK